jgi:hypothetical protein
MPLRAMIKNKMNTNFNYTTLEIPMLVKEIKKVITVIQSNNVKNMSNTTIIHIVNTKLSVGQHRQMRR